jgi:RNA-directed DNA polymerase
VAVGVRFTLLAGARDCLRAALRCWMIRAAAGIATSRAPSAAAKTTTAIHAPPGAASPDDPALARLLGHPAEQGQAPLGKYTLRLLAKQDGLCPLCGDHLLTAGQPPNSPEQWERWWLHVTRRAIAASYLVHHGRPGPAADDQTRLVHASCQRERHARQRKNPAPQLQPATPSRLA